MEPNNVYPFPKIRKRDDREYKKLATVTRIYGEPDFDSMKDISVEANSNAERSGHGLPVFFSYGNTVRNISRNNQGTKEVLSQEQVQLNSQLQALAMLIGNDVAESLGKGIAEAIEQISDSIYSIGLSEGLKTAEN